MKWMNLLFYIGGFPLWMGFMMNFWNLEENIEKKDYKISTVKILCLIALWVWVCWRIS